MFYRKSTNGGLNFGGIIDLSRNLRSSFEPKLAASQRSVHIVWSSGENTPGEIFYRKSDNNGITFGKVENLSNNVGNSEEPAIAVSRNNVYIVWMDDSGSDFAESKILYPHITTYKELSYLPVQGHLYF